MIGNAVHVMRIATGEVEEGALLNDGKGPAAVTMGKKSGVVPIDARDAPPKKRGHCKKALAKY